jgi:hypothetical protein
VNGCCVDLMLLVYKVLLRIKNEANKGALIFSLFSVGHTKFVL